MSTLRRTSAVLAILLAAGLPALALAETPPGMTRESALRQLDHAEHTLAQGHRMAAEARLERAETAALNHRSAIEGQPGGAEPVAALDHAVASIGEARKVARHGHLQQAEQKATEADQALRGA
jgi:hypothetical protein